MFAGAAFTDQADINADNAEAVDLLTTLNIIGGYPDGTFDPEGTVDRAEMAKMIYTIRNGGNDDASAHVDNTTSFTDINGHWAEGYIKYLQNTGIVAGKSATTFDPDSPVTTTEAMKMALALAGYDEKNAELTGPNWSKNTLTLATTIGLTDNVNSAMTAGCTRQDAAQILANVLGATAVRYSTIVEGFVNDSKEGLAFAGDPISVGLKWMDLWTNVGTLVGVDGDKINITMTQSDEADSDDPSICEFIKVGTDYSSLMGQKVKVLFSDHKNNSVIGVYAIPDNSTVTVNQKEIGTDGDRVSFGGESYALENEGVTVYIDGQKLSDTMRANYFKAPQSANVVTFVDIDDNGRFDAAVIKTVKVAKVSYASSTQIIAGGLTYKFAEDNIAEDVAKDAWVMITKNLYNDNNDIVVVEPITGTVNAVKTGTYYEYQIGDEWYNEGENARANNNIKSNVRAGVEVEAVVVNGIVFAAEKTDGEAGKLNDILFVTYIEKNGLNAKTASVMYPDGKQETIKLDSYSTDDDTPVAIQVGAYYEYSKSGSVYKLSTVDTAEDAYGEFTNIDNPTEAANALGTSGLTVDPEAGTYAGMTIADTADVIVYESLPRNNATPTGYNVKHITGKQLKNSFESDSDSAKFDVAAKGLGAFTSKVNGLTRVSSLAVLYTDASTNFDTALDQISGSSFYGYVTKDAVKKVVGGVDGIELYVWTGTENVKVFANTTKDSDFVAGTIVGYNAITEDSDGNKLIDGLTDLTATAVGSISEVGVNGDANTIRLSTGAEIDLDDVFDTVLYMNTTVKDENGAQSGVVDGTPTEANAQQGVRPTNFIRVGNDVAVIDSNAFVSGPYAAALGYSLPSDLNGTDVQWVDNRTQDNTPDYVYPGALVDLTFKVPSAGKLTINNVIRNSNGAEDPTYTFTTSDVGENVVLEGLLVDGNVTFSWNGATAASGTVYTNATDLNSDLAKGDATASGAIPTGTYTALPNTLTLKDAALMGNTTVYGDVVLDGQVILGSNTLTVSGGTVTIKSTANVDDLSKIAGSIVVERAVTAAEVDKLLTNGTSVKVPSISDSATALATTSLAGKTLEVVSGDVDLTTADNTTNASTKVTVGGEAKTDNAALNGTWSVGTLTTAATVTLTGDFTANTLAGCTTSLTVDGSLDVATTAPATLGTLALQTGADVTLPNGVTAVSTLTVAAGSAADKTTLVARGVTVATLALNADVDVTIAKLSGNVTGGNASAKLTFTDAQAAALALPAGTFVFQKAPTVAMTSIAAGTNLVFETAVDFKTIVPASIAGSTYNGATVKFTTAQPTAIETNSGADGAFYAAGATTTALANTQIKTDTVYELTASIGDGGSYTGWVEQ